MPEWLETETAWLIDNRTRGIDYCATQLKRSYGSVSGKLFTLRLPSKHKQLKENVKSHRPKVNEIRSCKLPVFHPVIIGLYPVGIRDNTTVWRERRRIILKIHDYQCFWCGDEADTADHIKPRHEGGIDTLENLVAACKRCNYAHAGRIKTW